MTEVDAGRGPRGARCWLLLAAAALLTAPLAAQDTFLVVVTGLGGDARFEEAFYDSGVQLYEAALKGGLEADAIHFLSEDPERDPQRIRSQPTRDNVAAAVDAVASASQEGDVVWVVLIGHGSFRDGSTRFNLPGPDMTESDFAAALVGLSGRQLVFVNTASSSGGFLEALSGEGRVVVTSTKSAAQRNETQFAPFFVQALAEGAADEDRNGRVSVLEAFRFASREVARYYETEELLVTEQALLDDNGDGDGSPDPEPLGGEDGSGDGRLASRVHLAMEAGAAVAPGMEALATRRAELSRQLEELRRQKGSLNEELYNAELERLLVEIARIDQQLRSAAESSPESEDAG